MTVNHCGYDVSFSQAAHIRLDDQHFAFVVEDGKGIDLLTCTESNGQVMTKYFARIDECEDAYTPIDRLKSGVALLELVYEDGKLVFPED